MVSYKEITNEELTDLLKGYIDMEYWDLNDFDIIMERAETIPERNIVIFKMSMMDLYLDTRDLSYVDAHPSFH